MYKMSAIAATSGIGSLAVAAVYYRFAMHMATTGGQFPLGEAAATLLLTLGGAVSPTSHGVFMPFACQPVQMHSSAAGIDLGPPVAYIL